MHVAYGEGPYPIVISHNRAFRDAWRAMGLQIPKCVTVAGGLLCESQYSAGSSAVTAFSSFSRYEPSPAYVVKG